MHFACKWGYDKVMISHIEVMLRYFCHLMTDIVKQKSKGSKSKKNPKIQDERCQDPKILWTVFTVLSSLNHHHHYNKYENTLSLAISP